MLLVASACLYLKSNILFLILPILLISGCDQFSRFNYENYNCGNNSTGINEIILGKVKKGSNVKLNYNKSYNASVEINKVSGKEVLITFKNKNVSINRDTASLTVKENNKVTIIECKLSKFKM